MTASPAALSPTTYTLRYDQRPWLVNAERQKHFHGRADLVAEWRSTFCALARFQRIPPLAAADITVVHHRLNRSSMPDTAACLPAAKAAIDGLIDARVFVDDGPDVVRSLTFLAPVISGSDALELVIAPIKETA